MQVHVKIQDLHPAALPVQLVRINMLNKIWSRVAFQSSPQALCLMQPLVIAQQVFISRLHLSPGSTTEHKVGICSILPYAMQLQRACPLQQGENKSTDDIDSCPRNDMQV